MKTNYENTEAPGEALSWFENAGHSMFMENTKLYSATIKNL